jgi:hypothetical protein
MHDEHDVSVVGVHSVVEPCPAAHVEQVIQLVWSAVSLNVEPTVQSSHTVSKLVVQIDTAP